MRFDLPIYQLLDKFLCDSGLDIGDDICCPFDLGWLGYKSVEFVYFAFFSKKKHHENVFFSLCTKNWAEHKKMAIWVTVNGAVGRRGFSNSLVLVTDSNIEKKYISA